MSEVGALIIKLTAETAQFRADLGKVKGDLNDLKDGADKTTPSLERVGTGGAGGLRTQIGLLDNAIRGAHAQAMADLIRKFSDTEIVMKLLPLAATGAAFVVVGGLAVAAVEKISAAIKAAHETVAEFGIKWAEANGEAISKLGSLDVEVLKLKDSTAKLYGKPAVNGPAIAAIEALDKINSLDKGVLTAISDMEKLMKDQSIGFFDSLITGKTGTGDITAALKPKMDAAKVAFAEVMEAENQLELDMVNKAGKAAIDADTKVLASKKASASAALAAVQTEATAQQKAIDDHVAAQVKAAGYIDGTHEEQQMFLAKQTAEFRAQQSVVQELVTGVRQTTAALQLQLGMETALTSAEKQHGAAEAAHSEAEALKKANIERLKGWEESFKAAEKYLNLTKTEGESKKNTMAPTSADLAAMAAIDPLLANALNDSKKMGTELNQWSSYLNEVAASEKEVAKAQEQQNETLKQGTIDQQIEKLQRMAAAGIISQQTLAQNLKVLYQQETEAKLEAVQNELARQHDMELAAQASGDAVRANRAKADEIRLQTELLKIKQEGVAKQSALDIKQGLDFQKLCNQEMTAWNNTMANLIVNGGNFSSAMRKMGASMAEDAIKYAMQEVETKIGLHTAMEAILKMLHLGTMTSNTVATLAATKTQATAAAGLAGANATASFALAPWPIDMGAPAFGASVMADALGLGLSAETGGVIPGSGPVPILGHGGETVVTKALTDRVERSEGGGSGGDTHIHNTFAPTIHAVDADGVDGMLKKHGTIFKRHIESVIRKTNGVYR